MADRCRKCARKLKKTACFCPGCGTSVAAPDSTASEPAAAEKGVAAAWRAAIGGGSRWHRLLRGWNGGALYGGVAVAAGYYWYSTLDQYEPSDPVTPMLIVAMTAGIVFFRRPIDRLLVPLQDLRGRVPKGVLIGAGLVVPLVMAQLFFSVLGLREYEYLRVCLVLGTIVSYILIRTPPKAMTEGVNAK